MSTFLCLYVAIVIRHLLLFTYKNTYLLPGAMRVMVSHGSKGGFHSNLVDEVDAPVTASADPDTVKSSYNGE